MFDCMTSFTKWLRIITIALPAASVWFMLCMLNGDVYSCFKWPAENVPCTKDAICTDTNSSFINTGCIYYSAPCKAPKTLGVELDTCDHIMNRNLHAESHMLAWILISGGAVIGVILFSIDLALSKHSYLQTMWINEYRNVKISQLNKYI